MTPHVSASTGEWEQVEQEEPGDVRSLASEIGWVLGNARLRAGDVRLRTAAAFCTSVAPRVHRSQVGRWETGSTSVTHAQVRQYEIVLSLPEGQLLAMVDVLARERDINSPTPHLVPPQARGWEDETEELLDLARSDDRMTGMQWRTLAAHLGSSPSTFLRRDEWTHLLRRVARESELCTGLDYVLRDEAKFALAAHPRSTTAVVDLADRVLSDPVAPVYSETVSLLLAVPGRRAVDLLLHHLRAPSGEGASFTLMWMARSLVTRGRVLPTDLEALARHAVDVLDDDRSSPRLHRAAASFLELLEAPERQRALSGLLSATTRLKVARIVESGGALADQQVAAMTAKVEELLAADDEVTGDLHPVFLRLLRTISSLSAEDARSTALTLMMLSPQGPVVGDAYARALRWALPQGRDAVVDEALSVLSWLTTPRTVPTLLSLGLDLATDPTRATQALVAVANARPPADLAPPGHAPDEVCERVRRSALAHLHEPGPEPAVTARGHLYLLGMYGRFDLVDQLAEHASRPDAPSAWSQGVRSWRDVPVWARPARA